MTDSFRGGEIFGDGVGNPFALTPAMVTAPAHLPGVWLDHECGLVLRVDSTGGTVADEIEFQFQSNPSSDDPAGAAPPPGAAGWLTDPIRFGIDDEGVQLQTEGVYRMEAAGPERFYARLFPNMWYRMQAQRVGGAVDTVLLVTAETRVPDGWEPALGVPLSQLSPPFFPFDGGYQALNIAAAAVLSAQLAAGETYHIKALAPCHFLAGDNAIVATAADYYMYAGETIQYRVTDGNDFLSVIRDTIDSANGFRISRASE